MLQKIREHLALALLTLLPLHALFVTVGTKWIAGPGHAPLTMPALWKEGLLAVILLIACAEITSNLKTQNLKLDIPDLLILSLLAIALLQHFLLPTPYNLQPTTFAHGFRYDFVPLLSFLILRRVPWSDRFKSILPIALLCIGALVAAYGIISFFLPATFFTWLGYSDLHSLYVPDAPLAAFQQIGSSGLRRIQSTMSGPNQLGLWLLIPLSMLLPRIVCHAVTGGDPRTTGGAKALPDNSKLSNDAIEGCSVMVHPHESTYGGGLVRGDFFIASFFCMADKRKKASIVITGILALLLTTAQLLTFSRAAWIGACVIILITLIRIVPRGMHAKIFMPLSLLVVAGAVLLTLLAPSVVLRLASSRDHLIRPMEAIRTMIAHPLGLGLGTAGPASNRTSDACVFLEAGSDPSWAHDRPDLCVFVENIQVQPLDRTCQCPFLPENWYLQIGVELGVLGFLLYLLLTLRVLVSLRRQTNNNYSAYLSFLSLSIAALFLHAWEDAATAWTIGILLACTLPSRGNDDRIRSRITLPPSTAPSPS